MTDQLSLFDADHYGEATPGRQRPDRLIPVVEPLAPGYTYFRDRYGVMPYAHLVASRTTHGAAATLCGKMGSTISNSGVTDMVRCGECDAAQQLLVPSLMLET